MKNCSKLDNCNQSSSNKSVQLEKCSFCNEINLWSYWHGGINNLDADILLVGQDWGNYHDQDCKELIAQIKRSNNNPERNFVYSTNQSITDQNLCTLFNELRKEYNIKDTNNHKVFFTNFVLCYRKSGSITGGFRQQWARNCSEHFKRLVDIIKPKIIICLGKQVYTAVMKCAGKSPKRQGYNLTIADGAQKVSFGSTTSIVFPMAHCGALGTSNRNKNSSYAKLTLQKSDWRKIKEYL